jgi:hypothetical protein
VSNLFYYLLHHYCLASDCELLFLPPAAQAEPDLTLRLSRASVIARPRVSSWYRTETTNPQGCPAVAIDRTDDGALLIRFADSTEFLVTGDGRFITLVAAPVEYTQGDLMAYALGPVAAIAFHLRGAVLLHAATVVIKGKAVLFAGESGSGKSTTAAILYRLGYAVLSDDVTEIGGSNPYLAMPSVAAIRLWPDVLELLHGSAAAFPDRAPSWGKKMISIAPADLGGPREIGAILLLEHEDRNAVARLARLAPREGWQRLIAEAYTARLPDPPMARKIFEVTSALADAVAMYSFVAPSIAASDGLGTFLERGLEESLQ